MKEKKYICKREKPKISNNYVVTNSDHSTLIPHS